MVAAQDSISLAGALALMVPTSVVLAAAGVGLIVLARRTADGRIGPNNWAGIRTRATRASPAAWRAAHVAARTRSEQAGWVAIATAILGIPIALAVDADDGERAIGAWGIVVTLGAMLLTGLILLAARSAQAAARDISQAA
ncbi:MAG: SdpI family protein [Actinomycetota bacterium]